MKSFFCTALILFAAFSIMVFAVDGSPGGSENGSAESFDSILEEAEKGGREAQYALALHYEKDGNMTDAVKWYRKAAEQGDFESQHRLGVCYEKGEGVPPNPEEAFKWYKKAAEMEFAKAQFPLGLCYEKGSGVKRDVSEAVKWYQKRANRGDAEAQYRLGFCYENYREVQSNDKAAIWYRRAAERGNAEAQYKIGLFYETGKGVEKNITEAGHWYAKAADQGNPDAQFSLGRCYEKGEGGVPRDMAAAVKWYRKALDHGYRSPFNWYMLGKRFEEGKDGLPKDLQEAAYWYRMAAEQGYSEAKTKLELLLNTLTGNADKNKPTAESAEPKAREVTARKAREEAARKAREEAGRIPKDSLCVTTDLDVVDPDDGVNSLREVLNYYQRYNVSSSVRFAKDFEINLSSSLAITGSISIDGEDHRITIIGPKTEPMFRCPPQAANLSLTLKNLSLVSDYSGDGPGILDISTGASRLSFGWLYDSGISRNRSGWVELVSVKDGGKAERLWNISGFAMILNGSSHLHRLTATNKAIAWIGPESILESSSLISVSDRADGDFLVYGTLKNSSASDLGDVHVFSGGTCEGLTVRKNGFAQNQAGGTFNGIKLEFGSVYAYTSKTVLKGTVSVGGIVSLNPSENEKIPSTVGKETDIVFDLTERTEKSSFSFFPHSESSYRLPANGQPHALLDHFAPFEGAHSYTVRVKEDQEPGEYLLADDAADFNSVVSLVIGDDVHIPDALSLGKEATVDGRIYSLALNKNKTLALLVQQK